MSREHTGFTFHQCFYFINIQTFPTQQKIAKSKIYFPKYNDQQELKRLNLVVKEKELFLTPNFSLKDLSNTLKLPKRYVSYLINRYHDKNYKEFINDFRIQTFLQKAQSDEKNHKTLLALALESGFNSKSTFNQVFKNHVGKTPSEYLR